MQNRLRLYKIGAKSQKEIFFSWHFGVSTSGSGEEKRESQVKQLKINVKDLFALQNYHLGFSSGETLD